MQSDDDVLASLVKYGSDLSKPHFLEYYFYFPDWLRATHAKIALEECGLTIVRESSNAHGENVLVLAALSLVPQRQAVIELSQKLESLATKFSGECGGWETAIVRSVNA